VRGIMPRRAKPDVTSDTSDTPTSALAVINIDRETKIWELIYEIWLFLADRNAKRAYQILLQQLDVMSPEDLPFTAEEIPSIRTIQRRVKSEQWDYQANDHIRSTAKHIDETQISRMFVISDLALSFAHQLLEAGYNPSDHAGVLAVKWDAAKEMLRFRGLGTAGAVGGTPTLEIKVSQDQRMIELDSKTPEERSELFKEGVLTRKKRAQLTGH
jgi:hypothetical protein